MKSGLCSLYVGLTTYWSFYHQLSWNILSLLTKLFKETQSYFSLIKIIYRHKNVPLISSTAEFMLFDKLKKNSVGGKIILIVRGHIGFFGIFI